MLSLTTLVKNIILPFILITFLSCEKEEKENGNKDLLQITSIRIGEVKLSIDQTTQDVPTGEPIVIHFSKALDSTDIKESIHLTESDSTELDYTFNTFYNNTSLNIKPDSAFSHNTGYSIKIEKTLKGSNGETFPGANFSFITKKGSLLIESISINDTVLYENETIRNIDLDISINVTFDHSLDTTEIRNEVALQKKFVDQPIDVSFSNDNKTIKIINDQKLDYYSSYTFKLTNSIESTEGFEFQGFSARFHTGLDSSNKFPEISDEELLTKIQRQTFKYFWDFGHPVSGLARERSSSNESVTSGGSGFGVMAIIVGIERGFITREEGIQRMNKIVDFLKDADRFHGAWSHWLNGSTGEVIPFSSNDDGGDLVETSYMIQGLLTFRQYLDSTVTHEKELIDKINNLWHTVEWDWYTQGGQNVLYWHWSPNYGWEKDFEIKGYHEALITYICAASSPTHPIEADVYHEGWASDGNIVNGNEYYGYELPLGNQQYGGPLFFEHYTYLGIDPRNLSDTYADYWKQVKNHTLINWAYCADNPKNYVGYSDECWGLTASDGDQGYSAHSPTNDRGVITPTAAISSIPYTPEKSMDAIHHFYYMLGDKLWGEYGFHDAFNPTEGWWASSYLAIDQGPIICMIENYRTGLLWDLFMSAPEIQNGLDKLGFSY